MNLTPEYFTLSGVEEGVDYTPGSTVTLTLTPGEYLDQSFTDIHMEHIYIHVNDKVIYRLLQKPAVPLLMSCRSK